MSFSNFPPYVPTQPAFPNPTPMFAQPPQPFMPTPLTPPQPVQQNFLAATPVSPIAPPTVTNPLAGFDLLGLSSAAPAKIGKEAFVPAAPPKKTIQQLEMERRVSIRSLRCFPQLSPTLPTGLLPSKLHPTACFLTRSF